MTRCVNLNKEDSKTRKFYQGFGFFGQNNNSRNFVEMGKYKQGKLKQGIKFDGFLNLLEMGEFGKDNALIEGLKRFKNGDKCISIDFSRSRNEEKITGRCVYIYSDGSFIYGDFKGGIPNGKALCYQAEDDKFFYREYRNKKVLKEIQLFLNNYNMNLKANLVKDEGLYYDLDKANFTTYKYDSAESYSMGFPVESSDDFREHGLGFIDWTDENQQFIGEWIDKKRTGLGSYFYGNQVVYGVYKNDRITENSLVIFDNNGLSYGMKNSPIPRFTLYKDGDFSVRNSGDYVLYVKSDFTITVDKYNNNEWVSIVETLIKNI